MKKFIVAIIVFAFLSSGAKNFKAPGDSIQKTKKIQFNGVYAGIGLFISPSTYMKRERLKTSWPAFSNKSYANYMESDYSGSGYTGNTCFEIGASFYSNFGKIDSMYNRWQMKIGITYLTGQSTITSFENYDAVRIDTLISSSGGPTYYKDQVYINTTYISHSSDFVGINISETFTSNFKKFFSFTGGLGLSAMIGVSSRIYENSAVGSGTFATEDSIYDYNDKKPVLQNASFVSEQNSYTSSSVYSAFTFYFTGGANLRWIPGKKDICVILNPIVNVGIRNLNISKGGNYTNAFILPSINLRLVFK
jgi:hypothetical protein